MPPKKAKDAKGKKKKQPEEPEGPPPSELVKKFKKAYNEACKQAGIPPIRPIVKKFDEYAEEEQILSKLVISMDGFGVEPLRCLLIGLRQFNFIPQYSFLNAMIGDEGIQVLLEFMKDNPMILELEVLDKLTPVSCQHFKTYFQTPGLHLLSTLTLDYNGLGDEGVSLLTSGIREFSPMKRLSLNHCSIGAGGGCATVMNLLSTGAKCQIEYLSLSGNMCGLQTLALLGKTLPETQTLQIIDLSSNGISENEEAFELFRGGLLANHSLVEINLNLNPISDAVAQSLLELIGGPRQDIIELRLTEHISTNLTQDILKVLESNRLEAIARAAKAKPKKKKKGGKKKK
ncbi:hypothetical protein BLNAU_6425 [Blattamonas nauphoetae]|uniref:Uncharacterized protein n=1 Tax=Blattamonas nauphoetae TaxID=2049346 RepID=A0ABQ9Y4I9_9EUKA|nr:hypothetical protein BLNAU_6425 [Blattamonas nauphoetae]